MRNCKECDNPFEFEFTDTYDPDFCNRWCEKKWDEKK